MATEIKPHKKMTWQERCVQTDLYHKSCLKNDRSWRIFDTAKDLNRSLSSVATDINLAEFLKIYPKQLERMKSIVDACEFVRVKKLDKKMGLS